jgi:hypothetical protein
MISVAVRKLRNKSGSIAFPFLQIGCVRVLLWMAKIQALSVVGAIRPAALVGL